jgi:sulfur-carrier protein
MKRLRVLYFAELAERAGCAEQVLMSSADTLAALYAELQQLHGFRFAQAALRPAHNGQFADWNATLQSGDEVSFLPPFSGG